MARHSLYHFLVFTMGRAFYVFTWDVAHRSAPRFPLVWQMTVQVMRDLVTQLTGGGMSPSAPVGWRTHVLNGAWAPEGNVLSTLYGALGFNELSFSTLLLLQ